MVQQSAWCGGTNILSRVPGFMFTLFPIYFLTYVCEAAIMAWVCDFLPSDQKWKLNSEFLIWPDLAPAVADIWKVIQKKEDFLSLSLPLSLFLVCPHFKQIRVMYSREKGRKDIRSKSLQKISGSRYLRSSTNSKNIK